MRTLSAGAEVGSATEGRRSEQSERVHPTPSATHHVRCVASPELDVVRGARRFTT
jgi:hypothetical protein